MKKLALLLSAVLFTGTLPSAVSGATILTFDGLLNGLGNPIFRGDRILQTYGDRIGDTPNVVVDHRGRQIVNEATGEAGTIGPGGGLAYWDVGYGDLVNNAFWGDDQTGYYGEITLTADPGYEVVLNSFDLASFSELAIHTTGQPVFIVEALNGAILANYSGTVGAGSNHTHYNVGIARNTLTIRFGDNYNIGIDNVSFSQQAVAAVPEPGSMTLLGVGLVSLAGVRRWKKKRAV